MATLQELANLVEGKVIGNANLIIDGVSSIDDGTKGTITFVEHKKYHSYISTCPASAIMVSNEELLHGKDGIVVQSPQLAFVSVLNHFSPKYPLNTGIHETAIISTDSTIGNHVSIGPFSVVEQGVVIEDNVSAPCILILQNFALHYQVHMGKKEDTVQPDLSVHQEIQP